MRRFRIDASTRQEAHGALVDARLLAEVYLELVGGRQSALDFTAPEGSLLTAASGGSPRTFRPPRPHEATAQEIARHEAFLRKHVTPAQAGTGGRPFGLAHAVRSSKRSRARLC